MRLTDGVTVKLPVKALLATKSASVPQDESALMLASALIAFAISTATPARVNSGQLSIAKVPSPPGWVA